MDFIAVIAIILFAIWLLYRIDGRPKHYDPTDPPPKKRRRGHWKAVGWSALVPVVSFIGLMLTDFKDNPQLNGTFVFLFLAGTIAFGALFVVAAFFSLFGKPEDSIVVPESAPEAEVYRPAPYPPDLTHAAAQIAPHSDDDQPVEADNAASHYQAQIKDLQRQLDELRAQQERTIAESKREPIRPSSVQSEPQQPKRSEVHHYYHRRSSGGCFSGFFIFLIILIIAFSNLYASDSGTQQKKSAGSSTANTPRATATAKPKNMAPGIDGSNAYDVVGSLRDMGIKCERSDSPTGYSWTVSDMSDGVMSTIDIISNKDYEICLISFSMKHRIQPR